MAAIFVGPMIPFLFCGVCGSLLSRLDSGKPNPPPAEQAAQVVLDRAEPPPPADGSRQPEAAADRDKPAVKLPTTRRPVAPEKGGPVVKRLPTLPPAERLPDPAEEFEGLRPSTLAVGQEGEFVKNNGLAPTGTVTTQIGARTVVCRLDGSRFILHGIGMSVGPRKPISLKGRWKVSGTRVVDEHELFVLEPVREK